MLEDLYLSKINSGSKVFFAESIVPTFNLGSFDNFKPLFEIIIDCIEEYKANTIHTLAE